MTPTSTIARTREGGARPEGGREAPALGGGAGAARDTVPGRKKSSPEALQ